jgi:hypothetical protein
LERRACGFLQHRANPRSPCHFRTKEEGHPGVEAYKREEIAMGVGQTMGALLAISVIAAVATPMSARACEEYYDASEQRRVPPPPKPKPTPDEAIAIAEPAMENEQPVVAATAIAEGFPKLKTTPADAPQQRKALHAMAVALARTGGGLKVPGAFYATTDKARAANVDWAIVTLRKLDEQRVNDPVTQAELAEALAQSPSHKDEALTLLAGLAARDVMGSAHGYAVLTRLRLEKRDLEGAADASRRCLTMTKTPTVCGPIPVADLRTAKNGLPGA